MENFSQELVFALIFGVVLLVQFLLKHLRKRAPQTEAETEVGFEPDSLTDRSNATEALALTRPVPPPPRAAAAPLRRGLRRFSRRSLMGSRRAVQDAIVVAAILGPCRAYRPHDID
ncbi:MAG: hypothetical protein LW862_17310 [Rubrivivax sp.]|jgi:hypothetical protein|nr:hypothetical protein [Rubrivivax sp.]